MQHTSLESQLRQAIACVIGRENCNSIGLNDDLRDAGFDSLNAAELSDQLIRRFGVDPLRQLESITIEELMLWIREHQASGTNTSVGSNSCSLSTVVPRVDRLDVVQSIESFPLAIDDLVPNSLLLVLHFEGDVSPFVGEAIQSGLNAFPQLAGQIAGSPTPFEMRVEPSEHGVTLEWDQESETPNHTNEDCASAKEHSRYLPSAAQQTGHHLIRAPLFAAKVTRLNAGGSAVGLMMSHMLIDGVGLGLFLMTCAAKLHGRRVPIVQHDRSALDMSQQESRPLPPWYVVDDGLAREREWELADRYELSVFQINDDRLREKMHDVNASPWYAVTSMLCHELQMLAGYSELAMWCDIRGQLGIPRNYTGNVGCYWHESLDRKESWMELTARLRHTFGSYRRFADVYAAVKGRQQSNIPVRWLGTESHVLPVNLVPFSVAGLNLGTGPPSDAHLLTRNLHGLRISRSPSEPAFAVEACLPAPWATSLQQRLADMNLTDQP